ncbi:palladin-like [Macrobrachium rosenbergii]|uniref:palladin-like n=1 Tax=Macrobrachium rosenbergii TaxID=79674 RepID=UPI0034D62B21
MPVFLSPSLPPSLPHTAVTTAASAPPSPPHRNPPIISRQEECSRSNGAENEAMFNPFHGPLGSITRLDSDNGASDIGGGAASSGEYMGTLHASLVSHPLWKFFLSPHSAPPHPPPPPQPLSLSTELFPLPTTPPPPPPTFVLTSETIA